MMRGILVGSLYIVLSSFVPLQIMAGGLRPLSGTSIKRTDYFHDLKLFLELIKTGSNNHNFIVNAYPSDISQLFH